MIRYRTRRLSEGISSDSTAGEDTLVSYCTYTVELDVEDAATALYFYFNNKGIEIDPDDPAVLRKLKSLSTRLESADEKKVLNTTLSIDGKPVKVSAYWKSATKTDKAKYKLPSFAEYEVFFTIED